MGSSHPSLGMASLGEEGGARRGRRDEKGGREAREGGGKEGETGEVGKGEERGGEGGREVNKVGEGRWVGGLPECPCPFAAQPPACSALLLAEPQERRSLNSILSLCDFPTLPALPPSPFSHPPPHASLPPSLHSHTPIIPSLRPSDPPNDSPCTYPSPCPDRRQPGSLRCEHRQLAPRGALFLPEPWGVAG